MRLSNLFDHVEQHLLVSEIIQLHSENPENIYEIALQDCNERGKKDILDLGCGYGGFSANLKNLEVGSSLLGIDRYENNRRPFLQVANDLGILGEFRWGNADELLAEIKRDLDIILSGYSLYFFDNLLPMISARLRENGVFIAITHSESVLEELLHEIREIAKTVVADPDRDVFGLNDYLHGFTAENGLEKLSGSFAEIKQLDFPNSLVFNADTIEHCFIYIEFRISILPREIFEKHCCSKVEFLERLKAAVHLKLGQSDQYNLNKNDCIFICRKPIQSTQ